MFLYPVIVNHGIKNYILTAEHSGRQHESQQRDVTVHITF